MDAELQQELIETLRKYRSGSSIEKTRIARITGIINSPCFLTLIAGILLAVISAWTGSIFTKNAEDRQNQQAAIASKKTTMREFGEGIVRFTQSSNGMRKREIWLAQHQDAPDKSKLAYPDGRSFTETRDAYEKQYAAFNSVPQSDALCAYAKAIFREDKEITKQIVILDKDLDDYLAARDYGSLSYSLKEVSHLHAGILELMGEHIRKLEQK